MKIGSIMVNAAYLGERVLTAIAVGATKVWEGVSKYIKFADPVVESLCMKWSSDGIGLTPEDAAKVTDIGTTFQGNTEITSFEEFEKFTSVTKLVWNAFDGCKFLADITLPRAMTSIGGYAFRNCSSLNSINIPSTISSIGYSAFSGTSFECVDIEDVEKWVTISMTDAGAYPNRFAKKVYSKGKVITHASIPVISEVGSFKFYNFTDLKNVSISDGVESFSSEVFELSGIENCEFPNSVKSLGWGLFLNCKSLRKVILGASLTTISDFCCNGCSSLVVFDCRACSAIPTLSGNNAFSNTPSSLKIVAPDTLYDEWIAATNWSSLASRIVKASEFVEPTNE